MQETISSSMIRKKGKHPPLLGGVAGWGPDVVQERCQQRYCSLSLLSRTVGQVEPDKWPLVELARPCGPMTSVPSVRRGRVSFDG